MGVAVKRLAVGQAWKESAARRRQIVSLVSVVGLLAMWEAVCRAGLVEPLFLPAPSAIFRRAVIMLDQGNFWVHILASARRVLVGFAVAAVLAVPTGILAGTSPWVRAVVGPLLSFLRPLPSMSWIPLSLLWLGITETQKYSIVFMGSFASTVVYTVEATRNIDPVLVRAALNLGANRLQLMRHVVLPAAMPSIVAALKVMLGIAWTCVISAELVAAEEGLGFLIMNGKEFFLTDQVLLGMVLISVTVLVLDVLFARVEGYILPWRE